MPVIPATQENHSAKPAWTNSSQDPVENTQHRKGLAGVAQVVESLPSKLEALSSTNKNKNLRLRQRYCLLKKLCICVCQLPGNTANVLLL
jgi:hypothetical protein